MDLEFHHPHNGLSIKLHSDLLKIYGITSAHLDTFKQLKFPREVFWFFFRSLYGSDALLREIRNFIPPVLTPLIKGQALQSPTFVAVSSSLDSGQRSFAQNSLLLVRVSHLFTLIGLRVATRWAESALELYLLPWLTTPQKLDLLVDIAETSLRSEKLLVVVQRSLSRDLEALTLELPKNTRLLALGQRDPAWFASFILSTVKSSEYKTSIDPQTMDGWLRISLSRSWRVSFSETHPSGTPESGSSVAPEGTSSQIKASQSSAFNNRSFIKSLAIPPALPANEPSHVALHVESNPNSRFMVPDWLLFKRWRWMQARIPPRTPSTSQRSIKLPDTLSLDALAIIVRYIYDGEVESNASCSAISNILCCGADIGLFESQDKHPHQLSSSSTASAPKKASPLRAIRPFGHLLKFCLKAFNDLNVDNCLRILHSFAPKDAPFQDRLDIEPICEFVAAHNSALIATTENLAFIENTHEQAFKQIFLRQLQPRPKDPTKI